MNREEAIISRKAERAEILATGRESLTNDEQREYFDYLANLSDIGQQKLAEAEKEGNCRIYSLWMGQTHGAIQQASLEDKTGNNSNARRAFGKMPLLDYIGLDLSNMVFATDDEEALSFDLRMGDWTGCNFENTFMPAPLVQGGVIMRWCNFRNAIMYQCSDDYKDGDRYRQYPLDSRLEEGIFDFSDFTGADLRHQSMGVKSAQNCNFRGANLTQSYYFCVDMAFAGSDFSGANLSNAEACSRALQGIVIDKDTILKGIKIEGDLDQLPFSFKAKLRSDLSESLGGR